MGLDLINPHVSKILLAIEPGDSISEISRKIGTSYGYTHEWIEKLEEIDVIQRDEGVEIVDNEFTDEFRSTAETVFERGFSMEDAYMLPNFSGLEYRYSKTDAVYIWTKGGYKIARNQDDYPIFIDVHAEEVEKWHDFFKDFGVESEVGNRSQEQQGIYYVLFPKEGFDTEWTENASVTPLEETVEWMKQNKASFQPALEMVDRMYDLDLEVQYSG